MNAHKKEKAGGGRIETQGAGVAARDYTDSVTGASTGTRNCIIVMTRRSKRGCSHAFLLTFFWQMLAKK